jgi:hypothetical protein
MPAPLAARQPGDDAFSTVIPMQAILVTATA